jgi:hypothetical protein
MALTRLWNNAWRMKTLDEIAIEHGTDKATQFTRTYAKPHGYTPHFERVFAPFRFLSIKFLEIGVGGGESIRTWLEYFPNALVFGVDNVCGTNPFNSPGNREFQRYTFNCGDQTDTTFWKCFVANHGADFDVIIDDGGHYNDQIIITLTELWPIVRSGGLYCIEDLGVGTSGDSVFVKPEFPRHMDFIKGKLDEINAADSIAWMQFSKELAIFCKR